MCGFGDLDPCEVWSETPRRARKTHTCSGCGAVIQPGDAYLDHFSILDGDPTRQKACFPCWWTRELFVRAHGGQFFCFSELASFLRECLIENDAYRGHAFWTLQERLEWKRDNYDEWREHLAALLRRRHASPSWRARMRRRWAERHFKEGEVRHA